MSLSVFYLLGVNACVAILVLGCYSFGFLSLAVRVLLTVSGVFVSILLSYREVEKVELKKLSLIRQRQVPPSLPNDYACYLIENEDQCTCVADSEICDACGVALLYRCLPKVEQCFTGFGKNKSKYKNKFHPLTITVNDWDPSYNESLRAKARKGNFNALRRLRGKTVVAKGSDIWTLDYPVVIDGMIRRDPAEFCRISTNRFLNVIDPYTLVRTQIGHYDLTLCGTIAGPRSVWENLPTAFYGAIAIYAVATYCAWLAYTHPPKKHVFTWIFPVFLAAFSTEIIALANGVFLVRLAAYGNKWEWLPVVVFEEINKWLCGPVLPIIELLYRYEHMLTIDPWLPFLMHMYTLSQPDFVSRVVVHFCWNYCCWLVVGKRMSCVDYPETYTPVPNWYGTHTLERVPDWMDVTRIMQLIVLLIERNYKHFTAALVNFGYGDTLMLFFGAVCPNAEDVARELLSWLPKTSFTSLTGGIVAVFTKLLPRAIARSPTYVAIVTIASCLLSYSVFGSYDKLLEFLPLVDFSQMKTSDILSSCVDAGITIVRSFYAVWTSGNLWEFFVRPKIFTVRHRLIQLEQMDLRDTEVIADIRKYEEDVYYSNDTVAINWHKKLLEKCVSFEEEKKTNELVIRATKMLMDDPISEEEAKKCIAESQKLRSETALVRHTMILTKLFEREKSLTKYIKNAASRIPPLVIVLLGNPGTGKTALYEQIAAFYARKRNIVMDATHVGRLSLESKHPAEGVSPTVKMLIINDMVADHSQGMKEKSFSVGAMLQAIMDSEPLTFPSAAVDRKGITFNDVELFVITTNERSFVMPESTDRLQRRFDEFAIVVEAAVVDDCGKPMKEKEFCRLDMEERNERYKVKLYAVICSGKNFSFTGERSVSYHPVLWFWKYVNDRVAVKFVRHGQVGDMMKKLCPCGAHVYAHFPKIGDAEPEWTPIDPDVCVPTLRSAVPKVEPLCSCRLLKGHEKNPLWDHERDAIVERMIDVTPQPKMPMGQLRMRIDEDGHIRRGVVRKDSSGSFTSYTPGEWLGYLITFVGIFYTLQMIATTVPKVVARFKEWTAIIDRVLANSLETSSTLVSWTRFPGKTYLKAAAQYYRAKCFLKENAKYVLAGSAALVVYMASTSVQIEATAKVLRRDNVDPDSLEFESFSQEVNYPKSKAEEWNIEQFPVRGVVVEKRGVSSADLLTLVSRNLKRVSFETAEGKKYGYLLIVNSTLALSNLHYFIDVAGKPVDVGLTLEEVPCVLSWQNDDIKRVGESELVLVRHPLPGPWRDLMPFFCEEFSIQQALFTYGLDGSEHPAAIKPDVIGPIKGGQLTAQGLIWRSYKPAPDGECGVPMLMKANQGMCIVGTVSMRESNIFGKTTQGGFIVTRRMLERTVESFFEPVVSTMTFTDDTVNTATLTGLSDLSEFRGIDSPFLKVLGSSGVDSKKFQSCIKPTRLAANIKNKGFLKKDYSYPKRVRGVCADGVWRSAFRQTMAGIIPKGIVRPALVRRASDMYVKHVVEGVFNETGAIRMSPLSLEQAFFGDAAQNVIRCNFLSSLGPEDRHMYKTRNDLFKASDEAVKESAEEYYKLDERFKTKLAKYLREFEQCGLKIPFISGANKDEVRTVEKLENMQVRLFYTVDVYTNTLARMYLLPIASVLLDHPYFSKCFGKMNSGSDEWDKFFRWLSEKENLMDLDFKNFDISHSYHLFRAVAYIFYKLALVWYGNKLAAEVCYNLVFALCCQLFEHMGDYSLKFKGLPSGHILTLILNSIINVILMIMAYLILVGDEMFFEHVRPGVVGDDNACGVSLLVGKVYNLRSIKPLYEDWGYTVTDASKSKDVKPFVEMADLQFVKRKFRFEEELGLYVAPLDTDSVYKMLSFWTAKNSAVPYEQRMADCFETAQREMFLHGRKAFEDFKAWARQALIDEKETYCVKWFDFDGLLVEYKNGSESFMTWM